MTKEKLSEEKMKEPNTENVVEDNNEEKVEIVEAVEKVEATEEVPVEEVSVEKPAEEATEEIAEEVNTPDVKETPVEESEEASEIDKEKEQLKEQLSVIKEVRVALAEAYKDNKKINATNEKLSSDVEKLSKELDISIKNVEKLNAELTAYKAREDEAKKALHIKRLEKLSANFIALGQQKTIEELSALSEPVINEFESITKLALDAKNSEMLDSVTLPSECIGKPAKKQEKLEKEISVENLSKDDFLKGLCNTLSSQQGDNGKNSKRTIFM